MDEGRFMFVVVIPPRFELTCARGAIPTSSSISTRPPCSRPLSARLHQEHHQRPRLELFQTDGRQGAPPINLVIRRLFNPNGESSWFTSVVGIINQITLLTVILTGAAVIREREHGTLEHLLVMPLTAFEIAHGESLGQQPGDSRRNRAVAVFVVMQVLEVPFAGLGPAVVLGRAALSLFRDGARTVSRDDLALHGAIRAFDHSGRPRAAAAVGRHRRPSKANRSGCSV